MKQNVTFSEKLKYSFDNTISKGTIAIIIWLAILSLIIVIVGGLIYALTGISLGEADSGIGFGEAAWQSLMRSIDAGTVAGDFTWSARLLGFIITLGGIFIMSSLIGALTSGLESKIEELRKGRSRVLETNHTLILGWSQKLMHILPELIIANQNRKNPRIVILADKDKIEMDDEIHASIPDTKNTKIICRTGSSLDLNDIQIASPNASRSIIVLSPQDENADMFVIKSVLALTNNPKRRKEKYHIIAEIKEAENMEAANLVGGDEAIFVQSSDLIARVTAQSCRQSGLSVVYTELLDFEGDEIYFKTEPTLEGKTYKDALFAYEKSAVLGVMRSNLNVLINPPMDTLIEKNDQIIAVSEDDDTVVLSGKTTFVVKKEAITSAPPTSNKKERNLILGWNHKGTTILKELDNYVSHGSETVIVTDFDLTAIIEKVQTEIQHQQLTLVYGDITKRKLLDSIDVASFNDIIILSYSHLPVQEADSKTLISLLHLRNIADKRKLDLNIVSEMGDLKNRELAEVAKADDFIISDRVISLMLSQLSENKHLIKVFNQLFTSEGSEIYLKPVTNYVKAGVEMDFYTILESAAQKGHTALGYRIKNDAYSAELFYGIHLNPRKSDKVIFTEQDKVIILAEE